MDPAGNLVYMAEGQSVTFKLTRKPNAMRMIEELPAWARKHLHDAPAEV